MNFSVAKKDNSADSGNDEETVFDPFSDDVSDKNKKASMAAGSGSDSAIGQAAMEQERINDIYFTSELPLSLSLYLSLLSFFHYFFLYLTHIDRHRHAYTHIALSLSYSYFLFSFLSPFLYLTRTLFLSVSYFFSLN